MIVSSQVPPEYHGGQLIEYLTKRFTYLNRDEWLQRIDEGRLTCNEVSAVSTTIVSVGNRIAYNLPEFIEPPADLNFRIVYEDEWLLGVAKPGNLLVHHHGRSLTSNLMYQLRYCHTPAYPMANSVNRLDRETSGVVLVAKDREMTRDLGILLRDHRIEKSYMALVCGVVEPPSGTIDVPIGEDESTKLTHRFIPHGDKAKRALTRYTTIEQLSSRATLLSLIPETGRTHQLRVHCAAIGHPILGDKVYGAARPSSSPLGDETVRITNDVVSETLPRHALHCGSMSFVHPRTTRECRITAPLPDDFLRAVEIFKR